LASAEESTALVVIEPHSAPAELLAKNPVLLAKVINHLQLALFHPATAISTNRNGSTTLGISLAHYREPSRLR
jgi:hypothetical protein